MSPAPPRPGTQSIPAPGIAEQTRALVEQNRIAKQAMVSQQRSADAAEKDAKAQAKQTGSIQTGFLFDAIRQTAGKVPGIGGGITAGANVLQGFTQGGPAAGVLTAGIEGVKALGQLKDAILGLSAAAIPGNMQLLDGAWQQQAMTLGQTVAPVVPIISATVLTFADILKSVLAPYLDGISNALGTTQVENIISGIEGVRDFASAMAIMAGQMLHWAADMLELAGTFSVAGQLGLYDDAIAKMRGFEAAAAKQGSEIGNILSGLNTREIFTTNLAKVAAESRNALTKAGGGIQTTSNIGGIWKQMQTKALGMSPYERDSLTAQMQALKRLDDLVAAVRAGNLRVNPIPITY